MISKGTAARTDTEGNIFIGDLLKKFRKEVLRVTQERFSMDMGIARPTISRWENNLEPMPRYYIKKMIEVYGERSIPVTKEYRQRENNYYEVAIM